MQPTGEAADGEVEDYQIAIIPFETDWGDAPDVTPTLAIHNRPIPSHLDRPDDGPAEPDAGHHDHP